MNGWLDRRAARRWFERAARAPGADLLAREVERRMAERLAYIRHDPARILDAACVGTGLAVLRSRYSGAEILAVNAANGMLRGARDARPLAARARAVLGAAREHFVCAETSAVPLKPGACAMVWSNLALAWSADLGATIREWHRVLEVGGLLMFSTYGPDTLKELRAAFADSAPHVHPFADMHDIGDALVAAGFADPVMDMEMITLTYTSPAGLFAELRSSGQRNAHAGRRRALTGARRWARACEAYARLARDGRVPASFEVVYGHAWKSAPRVAADGRSIIRIDLKRPGRKQG
jgi:malonyl-CoA O-methyltransferase